MSVININITQFTRNVKQNTCKGGNVTERNTSHEPTKLDFIELKSSTWALFSSFCVFPSVANKPAGVV